MELLELIETRKSCRAYYADKPLPAEDIDKILSSIKLAPSAGNLQSYVVIPVTDKAVIKSISSVITNQCWIADASAVLVFCSYPVISYHKYGYRGYHTYALQDATLACAYAQLVAEDMGFGTCWVGGFVDELIFTALGKPVDGNKIPELCPVALLVIGYGRDQKYKPKRVDRIQHYEKKPKEEDSNENVESGSTEAVCGQVVGGQDPLY